MFESVLVPVDGSEYSERALIAAQELAGPGGRLVLLTVLLRPDAPGIPHVPKLDAASEQRAKTYLEHVAERVRSAGAKNVETHVAFGEPAGAIAELAVEARCDVIAMSTHGLGASGRYALGSIALKVLMTAPCPVLMIRISELSA